MYAYVIDRQYYNSITRDNLELIRALNNEIYLLKAKQEQNSHLQADFTSKNRPLALELKEAKDDVQKLQKDLENYEKQKASLKHARASLVMLEEQFKDLSVTHGALKTKYGKTQAERDRLYNTFESTVLGKKSLFIILFSCIFLFFLS